MIQSPLNYTGGKYKLLPQILPYFPTNINTFIDLFCGGCNVGINVVANNYIYNDISEPLICLFSLMKRMSADDFISRVSTVISTYGLSDVKEKGYDYYGCSSANGLSPYNREPYMKLRNDFNHQTDYDDEYYIKLYVLIVFAFNNQIRFNKNGDFNLPPGKRDFNQRMYGKLEAFIQAIHNQNASFSNCDFTEMDLSNLNTDDFIYADPPYLITCAAYNEQDGWNEDNEKQLLAFLDDLSSKGIRFALSNVLESKGKTNNLLLNWINDRPKYKLIDLNYTYNNANYHRTKTNSKTREVLVINYNVEESK